MITRKGTLVQQQGPEGSPRPMQRVVVTATTGLDKAYAGLTGELLGYTVPHGFAVIASDGNEILVHPESLVLEVLYRSFAKIARESPTLAQKMIEALDD